MAESVRRRVPGRVEQTVTEDREEWIRPGTQGGNRRAARRRIRAHAEGQRQRAAEPAGERLARCDQPQPPMKDCREENRTASLG